MCVAQQPVLKLQSVEEHDQFIVLRDENY